MKIRITLLALLLSVTMSMAKSFDNFSVGIMSGLSFNMLSGLPSDFDEGRGAGTSLIAARFAIPISSSYSPNGYSLTFVPEIALDVNEYTVKFKYLDQDAEEELTLGSLRLGMLFDVFFDKHMFLTLGPDVKLTSFDERVTIADEEFEPKSNPSSQMLVDGTIGFGYKFQKIDFGIRYSIGIMEIFKNMGFHEHIFQGYITYWFMQ